MELEVDDPIDEELADISENTQGNRTIIQGLSQGDLPVTAPVPEHITQPELEDVEVGTIFEHDPNIGGEGVASVEDEGAATVEEEGAAHLEEEGTGQVEEGETITEMDEGDSGLRGNTTQKGRYNLRPSRSREYSHRFDLQVYNVTNVHALHTTRRRATIAQNVFGLILTQMTARAGIKKH